MTDAKPYTKAQQLARGEHRYRRKVASPKQWAAIQTEKVGPCRVCTGLGTNGRMFGLIHMHHVVPRGLGGDDVADNIAPLCPDCHALVTAREPEACKTLCASLTDSEYAYAVDKVGEYVFERVYGIEYAR